MTTDMKLAEQEVDTTRELARKRIAAKRDFVTHVVVYTLVNGMIVLVWGLTGSGYFWPGWVMGAWGIGLVLQAWDLYWRRPITDEDIDAELRRMR